MSTPVLTVTTPTRLEQLHAQGYPAAWLQTQAGTTLTPAVVAALAARLGEAMATPRPGLTQETIDTTTTAARLAGVYPPAAYDDGELVPEAVPDHPWYLDDARCAARLAVLAALRDTPTGQHPARVAQACGVHRTTVARVAQTVHRLTATRGTQAWETARDRALARWEAGEESAATIAVTLGLFPAHQLTRGHPARAAAEAATPATA